MTANVSKRTTRWVVVLERKAEIARGAAMPLGKLCDPRVAVTMKCVERAHASPVERPSRLHRGVHAALAIDPMNTLLLVHYLVLDS